MTDTIGRGHCQCGAIELTVTGAALMRGICHCTICQAFNEAPYADITLFRARDVQVNAPERVRFDTYRPPPAVQRGKCADCEQPAIEYLDLPGLPKLAIVPSANLPELPGLPDPSLHIFYHRRTADVDDGLPRFSGYWRSQLAFSWRVMAALWRTR